MNRETTYVVLKEHTLGYIIHLDPSHMGILRASPLRGASKFCGECLITPHDVAQGHLRPATTSDFAAFPSMLPPDFADTTVQMLLALVKGAI